MSDRKILNMFAIAVRKAMTPGRLALWIGMRRKPKILVTIPDVRKGYA